MTAKANHLISLHPALRALMYETLKRTEPKSQEVIELLALIKEVVEVNEENHQRNVATAKHIFQNKPFMALQLLRDSFININPSLSGAIDQLMDVLTDSTKH